MPNNPLLNPSPTLPKLAVRPAEAAKALGVSTRTLYTWTRAGLIPSVKIRGTVMYVWADLERWLAERSRRATAALPAAEGGVA